MPDNESHNMEEQYENLLAEAKIIYPDIEDSIFTMNNITAYTKALQDFLNLSEKTPSEISNNQTML